MNYVVVVVVVVVVIIVIIVVVVIFLLFCFIAVVLFHSFCFFVIVMRTSVLVLKFKLQKESQAVLYLLYTCSCKVVISSYCSTVKYCFAFFVSFVNRLLKKEQKETC